MKIKFEASKSELIAAAEIAKFWDRCLFGWVKPSTAKEAERVSKLEGLTASMEIPEGYMDALVALANKYSIELAALIRGTVNFAQGIKGLISSDFKKELKGILKENAPACKNSYVGGMHYQPEEPVVSESIFTKDEYAA